MCGLVWIINKIHYMKIENIGTARANETIVSDGNKKEKVIEPLAQVVAKAVIANTASRTSFDWVPRPDELKVGDVFLDVENKWINAEVNYDCYGQVQNERLTVYPWNLYVAGNIYWWIGVLYSPEQADKINDQLRGLFAQSEIMDDDVIKLRFDQENFIADIMLKVTNWWGNMKEKEACED